MIDLFKTYVSEEAIPEVNKVLRSGWLGQGPKTEEFEDQFADYVDADHAISTNSATAALHLSLLALNLAPGSEVLTTPLTFVSTNQVILHAGLTPVFVDIDDTLNMDLDKARDMLTEKTRAIIAVHYSGNTFNMAKLYAFAKKHCLHVIEDAAHACGSTYMGLPIGSFGTTCFSFHAVKNLPMGDGGMITTNDSNIKDKAKRLRWSGIDRSTYDRSHNSYSWEYDVKEAGFKFQMNDINAAIGLANLKRLEEWNSKRRELAKRYDDNLEGYVEFPAPTPGCLSSTHLYVVRVNERDRVVNKLRRLGITTGVHYKPNHHYEIFRNYRRWEDMPETEKAYKEILSLPMHIGLTEHDVDFVCEKLIEKL